jgi:hypothetical protein
MILAENVRGPFLDIKHALTPLPLEVTRILRSVDKKGQVEQGERHQAIPCTFKSSWAALNPNLAAILLFSIVWSGLPSLL